MFPCVFGRTENSATHWSGTQLRQTESVYPDAQGGLGCARIRVRARARARARAGTVGDSAVLGYRCRC